MTAPIRFGPHGPLRIGELLGRGGEGCVMALADDPTRTVKLYHAPDAAREAKVLAMVAADLRSRCPAAAFPEFAVREGDGAFAGFVMPMVADAKPVHELFSPRSRRSEFPLADWRFLVRTALNAARAFTGLHRAGAVIGDVNATGVLVSGRAVVSLIDADSFQWGPEHPCRVGMPEYTAPELQGASLDGVPRTEQHDAFALAVLIFQILFLGRHPHAGVSTRRDVALNEAIAHHAFAYTRIRTSRLTPPPNTLRLADLPLGLATMFERSFAGFGVRPLASEWVRELETVENCISPCERVPSHQRPDPDRDCPWCRIDARSGVPSFGTQTSRSKTPQRDRHGGILETAMRAATRADRSGGEAVPPPAGEDVPGPTPAAVEAAGVIRRDLTDRTTGTSPSAVEVAIRRTFEKAHAKAQRALNVELDAWRERIGAWAVPRQASEVRMEAERLRDADGRHLTEIARMHHRLSAAMVQTELSRMVIAEVASAPIGPRGIERLATAGIRTAGDLELDALIRVRGIGDRGTASLLLWRDMQAVAIARNVAIAPGEVEAASKTLAEEWARRRAIAEERLRRLVRSLDLTVDALAQRAAAADPRLAQAMRDHNQTLLDLSHLGFDAVTNGRVRRPPAPAPKPSKVRKGTTCPSCGGPMTRRWARAGSSPNRFFLGCSDYPRCTGTRPLRRKAP